MKYLAVLGVLATLVALCSCGLVFDVDALGSSADADAAPPAELDAGTDGADAAPRCPPSMIDADGVCVDATEVTVAQYEPFMMAEEKKLPLTDDPNCAWLPTFEPIKLDAQVAKNHPIVNVNYCQAATFCKRAGKRLCTKAEWLRACTHNGAQKYSYGTKVIESACPNEIDDVKTRSACAGAYDGLFDMLGNAGEWVDACEDGNTLGPEHDGCVAMGLEHVRFEAACADTLEISRYGAEDDLGFRCCQ